MRTTTTTTTVVTAAVVVPKMQQVKCSVNVMHILLYTEYRTAVVGDAHNVVPGINIVVGIYEYI